ncbi:MAG: cytochrome c3 family protein [Nitrospirota bacterium]
MAQPGRSFRQLNAIVMRVFGAAALGGLLVGLLIAWHGPSGSRASAENAPKADAPAVPDRFTHDATTFPLRGAHRILKCEQCHLGGVYKNVPTRCDGCHNGQRTYGKPLGHPPTNQQCDACHNDSAWSAVTYRHDPVTTAGQCATCHNGQQAAGKPAGHIMTTAQCDTCHSTRAWVPTTFKHDPATTAGQCSNCHNGQQAIGKPPGHFVTTLQCDWCHRTRAWLPTALTTHDNPKLIGGHVGLDCTACHAASTSAVIFRDGTTYGSCANCHTRDYKPGEDDHRGIQADATCSSCHEHAAYRW